MMPFQNDMRMVDMETRLPIVDLQPFLKEKTKEIILVSDFETKECLHKQGIKAHLWEDCYTDVGLRHLHGAFNDYCRRWFFDNDEDVSFYDGLSFGSVISYYLYYDLETWIRIFVLFEEIASRRIKCTLYLSDKDYFPPGFDVFIEKVNERYGSEISIKETWIGFKGRNASVKDVVAWERNVRYFTKFQRLSLWALFANKFFGKHLKPAKDLRCFIVHMRDKKEYLTTLFKSSFSRGITLYYSRYFFFAPLMFFFIHKDIRIFDDFNHTPAETAAEESKSFRDKTEAFLDRDLSCFEVLLEEGRMIFNEIFKDYVKRSFNNQIRFYNYLKFYFRRYGINRTICGGHVSPETYYCAHLMKKQGGVSYYLPHGFALKDPWDTFKNNLADYFFIYSDAEKKQWEKTCLIPGERLIPISFRESSGKRSDSSIEKYRLEDPLSSRVLILGEIFHNTLNSRINCFHFTVELCALLREIGFGNVIIRPHTAFFQYIRENPESLEKDMNGYKLQDPKSVPLKRIIGDFHLVIGQQSTVIYDAITAGTIYLTLIRNLFTENHDYWFRGLFPGVCKELFELRQILEIYIRSPLEFYKKHKKSLDDLKFYRNSKLSLWKHILEGN